MNYRIRRAIEGYIQANGQQDTRDVIALPLVHHDISEN